MKKFFKRASISIVLLLILTTIFGFYKINDYLTKGDIYFDKGDFKESLVYYDKAISLMPVNGAIGRKAMALLQLGEFNKALELLNTIDLENEPNELLLKGMSLFYLEKYEDALEIFESVLQQQIQERTIDPNVFSRKGGTLYELGQPKEALKYLYIYLELDPEDEKQSIEDVRQLKDKILKEISDTK